MSLEAMKQALEALGTLDIEASFKTHKAAIALRKAIEQEEGKKPLAYVTDDIDKGKWKPIYQQQNKKEWVGLDFDKDFFDLGYWEKEAMIEAERILRSRNHVD